MNIQPRSSPLRDDEYRGDPLSQREQKKSGLNRLNSVQKATNLKKDQKWE